ncbi:MAG: hypothetical protein ACI8XC_002330 [Gammaproteobacteria bacterium]|jgi:hypothetical protein
MMKDYFSYKTGPWLLMLAMLASTSISAATFSFDSGSTEADGDLAVTCMTPGDITTVDVGESGIMNYASITVDADCILKFTPTGNSDFHFSQPVRLLVSGDVVIDGEINLDGGPGNGGNGSSRVLGGIGGPGGYNGGANGTALLAGQSGYGPGGGGGVDGNNAGASGSLLPIESDPRFQSLTGGSGGGGADASSLTTSSGAGGGGALLLASSGSVSIGINGSISAQGGSSASGSYVGGSGAAGMIHIIANTISGGGNLKAAKTIVESGVHTSTFSITGLGYQMLLQRLSLDLLQTPTLSIATVGGVDMSSDDTVSLGTNGDTVIELTSTGLIEGTEVSVAVSGYTVSVVTGVATLAADGTASVTVAIASGVSLITAYVSQSLSIASLVPDYNNEKIMLARLETNPSGSSVLNFYTETGLRVPDDFLDNPWQYVDFGQS